MAERTVTVNSSSKSYGVTGWRVGWTIAPPEIANGIRKVHDFLTVGAAAPLQEAVAAALRFPRTYYTDLGAMYQEKRDILLEMLRSAGFKCVTPAGAYYIMCDITPFGFADDVEFTTHMIEHVGVAPVPGSSFYSNAADGKRYVRFAFPKRNETFAEVRTRLARLRVSPRAGTTSGRPSAR
jgi:aminotransferase